MLCSLNSNRSAEIHLFSLANAIPLKRRLEHTVSLIARGIYQEVSITHILRNNSASIRVQLHNLRLLLTPPVSVNLQLQAVLLEPSHHEGVVLVVPVGR